MPQDGRFAKHRGAPGMSKRMPKPGAADTSSVRMAAPVQFLQGTFFRRLRPQFIGGTSRCRSAA